MTFDLPIKKTLAALLAQEDTDGDKKITIEDQGPKEFGIINTDGEPYLVTGTYRLSNLLQELVIAMGEGKEHAHIPIGHIEEPPVDRIARMIRDHYWSGLTRTMDKQGIEALISDSKNAHLESKVLRVYVPHSDQEALDYYTEECGDLPIAVIPLPEVISPAYVRSINKQPGILSLKLNKTADGYRGAPFVVPGGRFNEMYGWDSYFESVGLLLDGKLELSIGMADNFQYQIEHYGKILNANRSYYLTRTQPPFYSSMIREIYEHTGDKQWLAHHLQTAIFEYETVWMVPGKRQTDNGLNRYLAEGIGRPPEAEDGHFHHAFAPLADAAGMSVEAYEKAYDQGKIDSPEMDHYFVHDRSVRESGHDTSYRLEDRCADLNLVELNAFLYKYETDFAHLIQAVFEDSFEALGKTYSSAYWMEKALARRAAADQFLWNEDSGLYFDYDIKNQQQVEFISATTLTPLWAGMASQEQAAQLVPKALSLLTEAGGVASCNLESRGTINSHRPQKQWDYPNGWAPHQMMIWRGLTTYGFIEERNKILYRWLFMITRNAVDYNGTIPEKYDVVAATHKVFAEYGNVGTEFEYITKEGFGWMNASYQYGLSLLPTELREALNNLKHPDQLFDE